MLKKCSILLVIFNFALGSSHIHWGFFFEKSGQSHKDFSETITIEANIQEKKHEINEKISPNHKSNSYQVNPSYDHELKDMRVFEDFRSKFGKMYESEDEKHKRFKIFTESLRRIEELNADKNDLATYAVNRYSDMSMEEISCVSPPKNNSTKLFPKSSNKIKKVYDNDAFNWRDRNVVTSVKYQGQCRSCWAFSAIGVLEGQYALTRGQPVDLSVQELLDCFGSCDGYWSITALKQAKQIGGVQTDQTYPYVAVQKTCHFNANKLLTRITGVYDWSNISEDTLKKYLIAYGPISIGLNFKELRYYTRGIANIAGCSTVPTNALLLVGYGKEKNIPYWVVKNSWGADWGENGYLRIARGGNMCGITSQPAFATVS